MDTVTTLRELWRLRLYVAGVCVLALLAGAAIMYKSRTYEVGVATARILVDTPSSQVVQVAPKGSDTLGTRANLLASVMIDGAVKSDIASRAGLQPNQLVGMTDAATQPSSSGPAPVSAPSGPHAYVLSTQVLTDSAGDQLPIIEIDAQAPDRAAAVRLADSAITGLRAYLDSTAALERISPADRLQLNGLGAPQATTEVRGASPVIALVVSIVVLGLGCAGILAVLALVRNWRAASAREQRGEDRLAVPSARAQHGDNGRPAASAREQVADDRLPVWDDEIAPDESFFHGLPEDPVPARSGAHPAEGASDDWIAGPRDPTFFASPPADRGRFIKHRSRFDGS